MLIGFVGRMQVGKSTAAYVAYKERNFAIHSFAEYLKLTVAGLTGCSVIDLNNNAFKVTNVPWRCTVLLNSLLDWSKPSYTYREFLQYFGTEVARKAYPKYWIESTLQQYDLSKRWVIDDVRFPDEAEAIKSLGGVLIRIQRPSVEFSSKHISETQVDSIECDDIIVNSGSLIEFRDLVSLKVANIVNCYGRN